MRITFEVDDSAIDHRLHPEDQIDMMKGAIASGLGLSDEDVEIISFGSG